MLSTLRNHDFKPAHHLACGCRYLLNTLILLVMLRANLSSAEPASLIADHLDFGVIDQEASHHLTSTGTTHSEQLETEIGAFVRTYPVRTITGTGSSLSFTLSKPATATDLILEFQEIHSRRPQAHGYTVAVNGVDAYFRSYDEIGAGPNHFFFRVPAAALKVAPELTITITSAGGLPFSLGRVWLYADFFTVIDPQEQVYRPLAMMGETMATYQEKTTSIVPLGIYQDQINFANTPNERIEEILRRRLNESATSGRPLELLFNGPTWGGAPRGPDGQGGYFTDIRYSQLTYDQGAKALSASYPNMWGSAFWATFQDTRMQEVLKQRFLDHLSILPDLIDDLRARGSTPQVVFARELGLPLGEITDTSIRAAAGAGIVLDPGDGLDNRERRWLHQNDVQLWRDYAAWHQELFQRDAVVVDRGEVRPPDELAIDNQYAHTIFTTAGGPMKSRRWFGGQTGMVDGFWSSGEVFFDHFPQYDYVKANGKLGHVNIWAPFAKTPDTLRCLYDAGFRFAAVVGDVEKKNATSAKLIRDSILGADGCDGLPALLPPQQDPVILEGLYNLRREPGPVDRIAAIENLRIHTQCRDNSDLAPVARLAVSDVAKPGVITYRLDNAGEPFTSGLSLFVDGRIAPGSGNRIEVLMGTTEASLRQVAVLTEAQLPCPDHWELYMNSHATLDLGTTLVGQSKGLIRLVFHAEHAPDAAFLLECRVSSQWPKRSGPLAGNTFTMRQQRTLNLWIQERAVAERMLARHLRLIGDDAAAGTAREMLEQGRYRSIQRLLSAELAQMLPTRFAIRGHGPLGRLPMTITLPDSDQVLLATVHAATTNGCELSVRPQIGRQTFRLAMPAAEGSTWSLTRMSENRFRLARDPNGNLHANGGQVVADIEAVPTSAPVIHLPRTLIARFIEGSTEAIRVDCQDIELMKGLDSIRLPLVAKAPVTRMPERMTDPAEKTKLARFDRVQLTLDNQGRVEAIAATYGRDRGRIAKLIPRSAVLPFYNGGIELDNGNRYEFDFNTEVDTTALRKVARHYEWPMIMRALRPGDEILIEYSPYTERNGTRRIVKISQPYRSLLVQDFGTSKGDSWRAPCVSANGVAVVQHNSEPNNGKSTNLLMLPERPFVPGTVVYRITSQTPLGLTSCVFAARAFDDSSGIDFLASIDGGATWTPCGRFDNSYQNSYPQGTGPNYAIARQYIDLTTAVAGKQEFLLRLDLRVHSADGRFGLGYLEVSCADSPPEIKK